MIESLAALVIGSKAARLEVIGHWLQKIACGSECPPVRGICAANKAGCTAPENVSFGISEPRGGSGIVTHASEAIAERSLGWSSHTLTTTS